MGSDRYLFELAMIIDFHCYPPRPVISLKNSLLSSCYVRGDFKILHTRVTSLRLNNRKSRKSENYSKKYTSDNKIFFTILIIRIWLNIERDVWTILRIYLLPTFPPLAIVIIIVIICKSITTYRYIPRIFFTQFKSISVILIRFYWDSPIFINISMYIRHCIEKYQKYERQICNMIVIIYLFKPCSTIDPIFFQCNPTKSNENKNRGYFKLSYF